MTRKLALLVTIGCVAALLALAGTASAMPATNPGSPTPWILSDQADYAPASTVHLTGGNWQPGEAVQIVTNDTIGNTWSQTDNVTADASGSIADDVVLPNTFISNYSVTATGALSGTATTTFTDKNPPTVKISSTSPNPSVSGSSVTFIATVSGSFGTPTGTVAFGDGTTNPSNPVSLCQSAALGGSGGAATATCTVSSLALGARLIIAKYSGDTAYNGSGMDSMTQNVDPRAPSNLKATANGQNEIDLSWTASPDAANITNYVIFEGTTKVATLTKTATSAAITGLAAGSTHSYTIIARFTDSTNTNFDSNAAGPASATTGSACITPSVTTQPAGQSIPYGTPPSFSASASGTPAPTVQWQVSTNSGSTWSNLSDGTGSVSGSTSTTLTLTKPAVSASGNLYRAVFTNTCGSATTNGAKLSVTPASLGVTGITASTKVYDGTTAATIDTGKAALGGVIGSDNVGLNVSGASGAFGDRNVGSGKTVTISGLALTGTDAGNYRVTTTTTTADITQASITVTAGHDSKSYDGTTSSAVAPSVGGKVATGDTVSFSQSFDTKNVGTGKTLTPSGSVLDGNSGKNYQVTFVNDTTGQITPASLDVTGITASNKTYDGTIAATIDTGSAKLSGTIYSNDNVGLDASSAKGAFGDRNVGSGKTVTISGLALTGTDAGNYSLAPITAKADITAASLDVTGITASNKTYDGTAVATIDITNAALKGVVSGDTVSLNTTNAAGAFADKNVGTGKAIQVSGLGLSGADAGNYTLTQPTTTADITPKGLTGSFMASDKTYDGNTTASVASTSLPGVIAPDDVVLNVSGATFDTKNVGNGKNVTANLTLAGAGKGDYTVNGTATTKANITPAGLTVSGITASSKVWDGTKTATLNTSGAQLQGVIGNDVVTLTTSGATAAFASSGVGTWPVQVSGLTISGTDAGNYTLTQPTTPPASITPWNANGYGFYAPVGIANSVFTAAPISPPAPTNSTIWNSVKGGSTVPLKFNVYAGKVEQTSLSAISGFTLTGVSCSASATSDPVDFTTTGGTSLRYDTTAVQWIQNWQTPKGSGKCYRATVHFADGSALSAFFTTT